MINILFVCTGNICRSPTAEGVFKKITEVAGVAQHFFIDSAATHDYHVGEAADSRSQMVAKNNSVDLSSRTARQIISEDFQKFDYIIAMDHYNIECLRDICPDEYFDKVSLMLDYLEDNNISNEVPDPYYGAGDGFQYVYELLYEAAECLLKQLATRHNLV